jgi:hypothetical protein
MSSVSAAAANAGIPMSLAKAHPELVMDGFDAAFRFAMFVCLAGLVFTVLARDKKD